MHRRSSTPGPLDTQPLYPRMPRRRHQQQQLGIVRPFVRRDIGRRSTPARTESPRSAPTDGVDNLPFGHLPRSYEQEARAFDSARFSWGDTRALPARAQGHPCLDSGRFVTDAARLARLRHEEDRDTGGLGGWAFSRPRTLMQPAAVTRATSARLAGMGAQRRSQHSTSRNPRSPGPAYYQPEIWCGTLGSSARRRGQPVGVRC